MQLPEICQILLNYINQSILRDINSGLTIETPLLEMGIINSLQTLKLAVFIKKQFECEIPDDKLNFKSLYNIASIAKLIYSLKFDMADLK